jgi:tetratricopeptide (TPR) repeat protein
MLFAFVAFSIAQSTATEWYDKGKSQKDDKQYSTAIISFKKALELQPVYPEASYQLGWCYNELEKYNEAVAVLSRAKSSDNNLMAKISFEMGYAYEKLKSYDDAITYFNKTLNLTSDDDLVYKERGNCYYRQKEYSKALQDYYSYAGLETNINDVNYYYRRGYCENESEMYNEAVVSLKKCVEIDSKYPDGYAELAYAYYKLKMNNEALDNYRTASLLDNEYAIPIFGMADVYYSNLKNYDSAIIYYEKALVLSPQDKSGLYHLGWCYNDKEMYSDAIRVLEKLMTIDNSYDDGKIELGYAYYKKERYDDALAQFRPVMINNSKNQLSRYYAGLCYYLKKDQYNLKKMQSELVALGSSYAEKLNKYIK